MGLAKRLQALIEQDTGCWGLIEMTKKPQRGFTLIELMVTVAILAILSGIAYPIYDTQSRKGKRPDGITALEKIAQAEQRYFFDHNTFTTTVTSLPGISSATSPGGYYTITVAADTPGIASSFIVTATPLGGQASDACKAFMLYSTGKRDGTPDRQTCWGK